MIKEKIDEVLNDLNIPIFFIHKPDNYIVDDYLTYNFTIDEYFHSNNKNECKRYYVTFNYLTKDNKKVLPGSREIEVLLKDSELFFGIKNRGTLYIKDTKEFFTAITVNYYEFK